MNKTIIKTYVFALATVALFSVSANRLDAQAKISEGINNAGRSAASECGSRLLQPIRTFSFLIKTIQDNGPKTPVQKSEDDLRAEKELLEIPEAPQKPDASIKAVAEFFKCSREELSRKYVDKCKWLRSNFYDCCVLDDPALVIYFDCQSETAGWIKYGGNSKIIGIKPGTDFAGIQKILGPSKIYETPFYRGFEMFYKAGEFYVRFSSFEKDGRKSDITIYPRAEALNYLKYHHRKIEKPKIPEFDKITVTPKKDEAYKDPYLVKTLNELKRAVNEKNYEVLISYISGDITFEGSDGNDGKSNFIKYWRLDSDPKNSSFWKELKEVLRLGGGDYHSAQNGEGDFYTVPYLYNAPTAVLDDFDFCYATGENVNVRERPRADSKAVARISFEGVYTRFDFNNHDLERLSCDEIKDEKYLWYRVALSSGKTGYVYGEYLRSSIDYRMGMRNTGNKWRIKFFFAGD